MFSEKAACTLITNNYIADAIVCHEYIKEAIKIKTLYFYNR